ncbi:MAG: hypothetical protein JWL90_2121 [Chthoniobacteraceae bacterium]|nr:hypothetical protein [Chthoniobacteraceae bacterium]
MNDTSLQSLAAIADVLSKAGYSASADDSAAFVELQHEGTNYPAVIQSQGKEFLISCQVCRIGDFGPDQLALVATNALAANVQMLPYAFAILKPEDSADEEAVADSPLVIINSVPIGDFSEEELLWSIRKLQIALATAVQGIKTAVTVSKIA